MYEASILVFFDEPLFTDTTFLYGPVATNAYDAWNTIVESKTQVVHFSREIQLLLTCILEWYPHDAISLMRLSNWEGPWLCTELFDEILLHSYFRDHKEVQPRVVEYFAQLGGGSSSGSITSASNTSEAFFQRMMS